MASICTACQFANPDGFRYCGQCGTRLWNIPEAAESGPANALHGVACAGAHSVPLPSRADRHVERRQLTVLFCDIVGSTRLSQQLDPEDLRKVIRRYQAISEPAIERHGGYVSRFLGDGILAFFGYPSAHEDDARQAASAALEIIEELSSTDWMPILGQALDLAVRVGISTGLVVAGDLIGKGAAEEEAIVGETPNLAARLQTLAEPNTVLISARTRRLIVDDFEVESLGSYPLKGFGNPVEVWRVVAPRQMSASFGNLPRVHVTELVNRDEEFKLLLGQWRASLKGATRIVLLSGEAGIGKSRLTEALRDHLALDEHYFLRLQCSAYHSSTALYPVAVSLERAAQINRYDKPAHKRNKLLAVLRRSAPDEDTILPPLAALLSIPGIAAERFESLNAQARKQATLDALCSHMIGLTRLRPVLAVIEDIHWCDPTTLELIDRFSREQRQSRLLMVLTERADRPLDAELADNVTRLHLQRLSRPHATELVRRVSGGSIPHPLIERIVAKADGVALFAEELTKSLLEAAPESTAGGPPISLAESAIPETLHDLLMARLDQLGSGKRVAQIASVIGRQFSQELLDEIVLQMCNLTLPVDSAQRHDDLLPEARAPASIDVSYGLMRLLDSSLIVLEGGGQSQIYSFRHALIRDTAYGSLLREERRHLHRLIANTLEQQPSTTPELLARHLTEAGEVSRAIRQWLRAGRLASERSAYLEAAEHFQSGLALVRQQPLNDARDAVLLDYLVQLGPTLIATRGSGSEEVESVYREAVELTERLPESEAHFTALWGWWRISRDFETKAERAERLQELAERLGEDGFLLQAHHSQWASRFHLADHAGTRFHADVGMSLYADRDYRAHAARYGGHDARVCALGNAAQSLWLTGYPKKAVTTMQRARIWAEELKQSGSLVHVMDMNLLLLRYRAEPALAAQQARELSDFARKHQFPEYLAKAEVFLGWAIAKSGQLARGIEMMKAGIASHDAIGTNEDIPVWLEMLADGCLDAGRYAEGLKTIDTAFEQTGESGLKFWQAELFRRRGELLRRFDPSDTAAAAEAFEQARRISRTQGALSLELRALLALAELYENAPDNLWLNDLAGLYRQFDEGFETPDLLRARRLLDALATA